MKYYVLVASGNKKRIFNESPCDSIEGADELIKDLIRNCEDNSEFYHIAAINDNRRMDVFVPNFDIEEFKKEQLVDLKKRKIAEKYHLGIEEINKEDYDRFDRENENVDLVYDNWEYNQFIKDMRRIGAVPYHYCGRFYYSGPAVNTNDEISERDVMRATQVKLKWDNMGLDKVYYPVC